MPTLDFQFPRLNSIGMKEEEPDYNDHNAASACRRKIEILVTMGCHVTTHPFFILFFIFYSFLHAV